MIGGGAELRIEPLSPADVDEVGRLIVRSYRDAAAASPGAELSPDYLRELADVGARARVSEVLVARRDGRLVGSVTYVPGLGPLAEFDDPDAAGIRALAVAPEAQGTGVGRALVAACIERARRADRARIVLHTTTWMTRAQRLYDALGFARAAERDFEPRQGVRLLAYVLELPG